MHDPYMSRRSVDSALRTSSIEYAYDKYNYFDVQDVPAVPTDDIHMARRSVESGVGMSSKVSDSTMHNDCHTQDGLSVLVEEQHNMQGDYTELFTTNQTFITRIEAIEWVKSTGIKNYMCIIIG